MDRRTGRLVVMVAGALVCTAPGAAAQAGLDADRVRRIDDAVEAARASMSAPGITVAIGVGDDIVYSRGFGRADVENDVPVTPASVFRTASVTKPFTATAVLQLVEEGKLDLDASIRRYVPALAATYDRVTLRDLLRHTGGVRHFRDDAEYITTRHCATLSEALSIFASDPLDHPPGEMITYSSWGYTLLGLAIEAASGLSYDAYVRARVLAPAGTRATQLDDLRITPHRASGYSVTESGELLNAQPLDASCRLPAGGYSATAEDLVRFMAALSGGRLLEPRTFADMTRSHIAPELIARMLEGVEVPEGYQPPGLGFGWAIRTQNDAPWHGGNQPGFTAMLYYDPATRVTVAAMINLQDQGGPMTELAIQLAEMAGPR